MNIDIRKIICAAMLTMNCKTKTRIICWDYITKYIELLEIKYNTKINLIYEDDFNKDEYENLIETTSKNRNMYFILKENQSSKNFINLVDEKLLLSKEKNNQLINRPISNEDYEFINQYNKQYRLKQILEKTPNNNISFVGIFKLFMLRYSQKIGNKVDKKMFWEAMIELESLLNKHGIKVEKCNKLELFRAASGQYNTYQKYSIDNNHIGVQILDLDKYYEELAYRFNKKSFVFTLQMIDWIIDYKFKENKELQKIQTK